MRQVVLIILTVMIAVVVAMMFFSGRDIPALKNSIRLIERPVEVTRLVEIPVTRVIEVTRSLGTISESAFELSKAATLTPTPKKPREGSLALPVPIYRPAELTLRSSQGEDLAFTATVVAIMRDEETLGIVLAADRYNQPPPEGYEYLLVMVQINSSPDNDGVLEINRYDISVVTGGRIYRTYEATLPTPCCLDPDFDFGLLPGAMAVGWVALPVAIDEKNPLMLIGSIDQGTYFDLTSPEDD